MCIAPLWPISPSYRSCWGLTSGNGMASASKTPTLPGQIVLVMQGGGAQGAYQGGVYQALHEAGIGLTCSSALGNPFERRMRRQAWSRRLSMRSGRP